MRRAEGRDKSWKGGKGKGKGERDVSDVLEHQISQVICLQKCQVTIWQKDVDKKYANSFAKKTC